MRVTKCDAAHFCHEVLLLSVDYISDPETPICNISNAYVHSFVQLFHAYRFEHAGGTQFLITTDAVTRSGASESAPLRTLRVFDEAALVILLDGRHRLYALQDHENAVDITLK